MIKAKRRFNWKARQKPEIEFIKDFKTPKVQVTDDLHQDVYDDANTFVLPSAKRPTKKIVRNQQPTKILSKKQRKKLEKIVEKKRKKIEGAEMLTKLYNGDIQATANELDQFTSIAAALTKGRKRVLSEKVVHTSDDNNYNGDENYGKLKKRQKTDENVTDAVVTVSSHNLVAFDQIESDSESDSSCSPLSNDARKAEIDAGISHSEEISASKTSQSQFSSDCIKTEMEVRKVPEICLNVEHTASKSFVKTATYDKKFWVPVNRSPEIEKSREKLPIIAEEHNIMEMIHDNDVVIIAGETGSGKTTQVPQFLYEAGYTRGGKMIGITQPRRVAAISMSARVAHELNVSTDIVSYLIRFEGNVTDLTEIKFMTDGVLLKEIQSDFTLTKYSAVILDEAHERNTYTDILIGLLSRIVPLRRKRGLPLKLIIMSATLRTDDFTSNPILFKSVPPVMNVEARQFPVSVHFSKYTAEDYLTEAYKKVCKIHSRLPEGGVLVFVTGQREVNTLVRRLRAKFPYNSSNCEKFENAAKLGKLSRRMRAKQAVSLPHVDLDSYDVTAQDDTEGDRLEIADDASLCSEGEDDCYDLLDVGSSSQPLWVLPFYSLLPPSDQSKVFKPVPAGCRFCVVSTNVAETSLTIPGIKYVVDTGRTKTRLYDKLTGVSTFAVTWCSKASANQRAGRSGRLGPGHCYRLYSSAVFNDNFLQFDEPEIRQKPVDALVLTMKALSIVKVVNFPFPTPPDPLQLGMAERRLELLGALYPASTKEKVSGGRLTPLGRTMAAFPVAPRYAKMLAISQQHNLLAYVVCIVAALSVPEVLEENDGDKKWATIRRQWAGTANSFLLGDVMVLLRAVGAADCSKEPLEQFCIRHGLRHKAMREIRKLRVQLTAQLNMQSPGLNLVAQPDLPPPTDTQTKLLRQIVLAGLSDQVAYKMDPNSMKEPDDKRKWKKAYKSIEIEEPLIIRSTSVLSKQLPEWIVYQEAYESNKLYMRGITAIEPEWLPLVASSQCNLTEPMADPPPRFDSRNGVVLAFISGTYGRAGLPLPVMEVPYTTTIGSYKWFARFLLQGDVYPSLERFVPALLSTPATMVKSWSKLQSRTEILLNALAEKEINTRDKLSSMWNEEPTYLMAAYMKWLPESAHAELSSMWPPM